MWYLAEILFAEPPDEANTDFQCEACNVVFQTADAVGAYRRAIAWGRNYAAEPPVRMLLLGVSQLTTVSEELGDGTEICGRFFEAPAVWELVVELVPPPSELKAVIWEQSGNVTLGELLDPEQIARLRRVWGRDAETGTSTDDGP